ncbi:MAG TPA: nucleotidyltransferase family protein [Rhizomicrobium sp.]|nr:nucleotidyltransferase family protein [Rhizomicrobium sp.]
MSNKPITRAMIMAAGLGTRMRPLTNDRPKPLVEVGGRALIDHAIDRLVAAGVTFIVVNVHYRAAMLREHLAKRKDVTIVISDESEALLDSGGGIAKALALFEGEPFFTHNSDSVWVEGPRHALDEMKARYNPDTMDSLMLVAPTVNARCYAGRGDFLMGEDGRLTRVPEQRLAPFVWIGVQILHPRLFDGAPDGVFSINPLWDRAIANGRLFGLRLDGIWMHIDRPDAVADSERFLAQHPSAN